MSYEIWFYGPDRTCCYHEELVAERTCVRTRAWNEKFWNVIKAKSKIKMRKEEWDNIEWKKGDQVKKLLISRKVDLTHTKTLYWISFCGTNVARGTQRLLFTWCHTFGEHSNLINRCGWQRGKSDAYTARLSSFPFTPSTIKPAVSAWKRIEGIIETKRFNEVVIDR